MSAEIENKEKVFTHENLDMYLGELAKEYRRLSGRKTPAEIILVGGAAIISQYSFRNSTTDIDAVIQASSAMKEAITRVEDRYNLPYGWINTDFQKTTSYSRNIVRYSSYYRSFYQILSVRVLKGEYLLAMKLRAYRGYKHDISDIVGVLWAHKDLGKPITMEKVEKAVIELYGTWDGISPIALQFIKEALECEDYKELYNKTEKDEQEAKAILVEFEKQYPNALSGENIRNIIESLRRKKQVDQDTESE